MDDEFVTVTLTRSEWDCFLTEFGRYSNADTFRESHKAHGHSVMDVFRKLKRIIRNLTSQSES